MGNKTETSRDIRPLFGLKGAQVQPHAGAPFGKGGRCLKVASSFVHVRLFYLVP
jgi:hypothetical protein